MQEYKLTLTIIIFIKKAHNMFRNRYFISLFCVGISTLILALSSWQTKKSEINQNTESKSLKDEIILNNDPNKEIDLEDNKQNFDAFMKIRSSVEGLDSSNQAKESIYYWEGTIYSFVEGERSKKIMGMKGFSVSRWVKTDSARQLLTREVALYTDPKTGQILEKMATPFSDENLKTNTDSLDVIHVWNDPVNQYFPYFIKENYKQNPDESIVYSLPYTQLGEDMVCFYADIFLAYPSKITRKEFPQNVQSDLYQGAELFQFFVRKDDLENPMLKDIPATISWTRIGQWLPFMSMGDTKGNLVYQCRGYKVLEGFEGLPQDVKEYVRAKQPIFEHAPTEYSQPNETSWTYFKKIKEKGE